MPKAARPVPRDIPKEPPQTTEKRVTLQKPWPLPAVVVAYHITYDGHPDSYPLHIAGKVLSDGQSSRIYQKLVYDTQLAVAAFGGPNLIEDPNLFYAVAIVQPGRTPDQVADALIAEFERLKNEPISERELQRAKNQFARDYILGRESNQQKARQLSHAVVIHHDIKTADGEFDIFQGLTGRDVQRVARTYFTTKNRTVLTLMPSGKPAPSERHRDDRDTETNQPQSHRDTEIALRKKKTSVTPWLCGLLVSVSLLSSVSPLGAGGVAAGVPAAAAAGPQRQRSRPTRCRRCRTGCRSSRCSITSSRSSACGCSCAPAARPIRKSKIGLAHLVASLLDQGTEGPDARSAEEFNDAIDFIGGVDGAGAGSDLTFLNMVVMKDSFDAGLRMLSDMARHPAFAQAEIERQRQQMLSSLQVSFDDPEFIANAVFDRLVYGFHPYGLPQTGTPETIARLTRDDVTAFHRKYFVPNNAILAIVGDVTAGRSVRAAGKVFGDWERREVPAETIAEPPDADPARRHRQQAGRGADRSARGQHRHPAEPPRLHGREPRDPDPRRRRQQPPASGAADGARPDLRRAGELRHVQGQRRLRGRNQHADGRHRRSAAAHRGRVLAAAARARRTNASWPTPRRT